ncbi:MAG: histidine phosphatase family protein [Actinomycetota bacterium]|nr:histidine phosphatase family protein [Actinomycetota bacterium]
MTGGETPQGHAGRGAGTRGRLLLVRHAKATPQQSPGPDHDRPLVDRGRRDAQRLGAYLEQSGEAARIGLVLCSTATRARGTLEGILPALPPEASVVLSSALYPASAIGVLQCLGTIVAAGGSVAVVAHNPGIEDLARLLSDSHGVPAERLAAGLPTCALVTLDVTGPWDDLRPASAAVTSVVTPGDLR